MTVAYKLRIGQVPASHPIPLPPDCPQFASVLETQLDYPLTIRRWCEVYGWSLPPMDDGPAKNQVIIDLVNRTVTLGFATMPGAELTIRGEVRWVSDWDRILAGLL